jgi:guanylate cyclase
MAKAAASFALMVCLGREDELGVPIKAYQRDRRRLPAAIERVLSFAVVPGDTTDDARTKKLFTGIMWITLPATAFSTFQMVVIFEAPYAGSALGSLVLVIVGVLFALWLRPSTYPAVMHVIVLSAILVSAALVILFGGFLASGANSVWGFISVLGALAIFGDRRATFWLWVFVVTVVGSAVWANQVDPIYTLDQAEYAAIFNLLSVVVLVYFIMFYYVRQRALLLEESDGLLHNILPDEIADRLKSSDEKIADSFDSASVLFADVVDFTPMSADMSPNELVSLLDQVFSEFDDLVEKRDLEKIKTIGDAYMVAAGVPESRQDHALILCDLALAMHELVRGRNFGGQRISFRIGINSGPVVAGIIGTTKFSYDLWGDTVNTASRMESSGTADHTQISEATRLLVKDEFVCESKGIIEIKGKGPMPVFHLRGRLESSADD